MKTKKGLTLIEIILSIAIIGIILIPIFTIFNSGLSNILKAGNRTENVYTEQGKLDALIEYSESRDDGMDLIKVTIPGIIENREIRGKIIISDPNSDIKLKTFVPNKVLD